MVQKIARFIAESPVLRRIVALVAGVLVLGLVVLTLQEASAALHPLPEGVDPFDPADAESFEAYLESMPPVSWALVFFSELLGALFGGLTAGWIADRRPRLFAGLIVGLAVLGSVMNWVAFSHPVSFMVGQLVGYAVVSMTVTGVLDRKRSGRGSETSPT